MTKRSNNFRRGQTLVEALVALSLLTTGFIGIATLLTKSFQLNRITSDDTQATYLASEGIEVAKNLIDNDVYVGLAGSENDWDKSLGLNNGQTGYYQIEYDTTQWPARATTVPNPLSPLYFNPSTHLYSYQTLGGTKTDFTRYVKITAAANELDVQSVVRWNNGTLSNTITLEDQFYNWHPSNSAQNPPPVGPPPGGGTAPVVTLPGTTVTLAEETDNNTSGADSFQNNWPNGDENTGNISKINIHTLLYPGNTTKIFALVEPWFCQNSGPGGDTVSQGIRGNNECQSHLQNGNDEDTVAYVKSMVTDMISRGIDGATCDFEGVGANGTGGSPQHVADLGVCDKLIAATAATTGAPGGQLMMDAMEDSTSWSSCATDDASCILPQMERDLLHIATYYNSPSYYKVDGQPVLLFFGLGSGAAWDSIMTQLKTYAEAHGNPLFVPERVLTGGAAIDSGIYDWPSGLIPGDPQNWNSNNNLIDILKEFNGPDKGLEVREGTAYKGFDDVIADWEPIVNGVREPRIYNQNCGESWAAPNGIWNAPQQEGFSASNQLPSILIATWSDYEEGTEIETGINNCMSLSATVVGKTVQWTPSFTAPGSLDTVNHFTIYAGLSPAGANPTLTVIDNVSSTVTSVDLSSISWTSLGLPAATYNIYVQAYGQASIINHWAPAGTYTAP